MRRMIVGWFESRPLAVMAVGQLIGSFGFCLTRRHFSHGRWDAVGFIPVLSATLFLVAGWRTIFAVPPQEG